jgi:ribosomal-protein-alanine N-acetyltransferase
MQGGRVEILSTKPCGLQIRPAVLDDVEAVLALDRATALLPHWTAGEYARAIEPAAHPAASNRVHRSLFIAESGNALAGFVVAKIARIAEEVSAELESIAVAASARRQGVGRALCGQAIEWVRLMGAHSIELEVRSQNEAAISLYAGLGFAAEGIRSRYYRDPADDALLMRLNLISA